MKYQHLKNWQKLPELTPLKDLTDPPKNLYYLGKWSSLTFNHCVAIVGSRRMTEYGKRVIEKIVPQLVFERKTIVSGFIYGVDQYAHQVCLENGGITIAVLGWGINYPLSDFDLKLAHQIIKKGGLLISEWENQKPALWTFPQRNRLVAALAKEIIVVEAAQISGALITTRIANKLNRSVWAVPGPITSKTSFGTNYLIKTGKAKMWLETPQTEKIQTKNKEPFLNLLENEPLTADEIARKLNLPISQIGAQLSLLTLSGHLIEKGGKYYLSDVG